MSDPSRHMPRLGWPFIVALTLIAWLVLNLPAITLTLVLR